MARVAYSLALESPRVAAEVIEINEFPELAQRYQVRAVPLTVIATGGGPSSGPTDRLAIPGAVPEKVFVEQVLKAVESPVAEPGGPAGQTTPAAPAAKPRRRGRGSGIIIP
jgi:predicted DsbA family dithiol-disulfide isomerase